MGKSQKMPIKKCICRVAKQFLQSCAKSLESFKALFYHHDLDFNYNTNNSWKSERKKNEKSVIWSPAALTINYRRWRWCNNDYIWAHNFSYGSSL